MLVAVRLWIAIGAALLAAAAPARAVTTIGVPTGSLTEGGATAPCAAGVDCTYVQQDSSGNTQFTAPSDGVIVRWRLDSGSATSPVTLRVLRPLGGGNYTGAGTGTQQTTSAGVNVFPERLPIRAGEAIGVDNASSALLFGSASPALRVAHFTPFLTDGSPPTAPTTTSSSLQIEFNADIEADADNDGFGDESQDSCLGLTGSVNGCPRADLQLTQTATPGAESDLVTYKITVTNSGPDPVPDATVSDALPAGAILLRDAVDGGAACPAPGGGVLTCPLPALGPHTSASVTVQTALKKGANRNGATVSSAALLRAAGATGGAGDPNAGNGSATVTNAVAAPAITSARISRRRFRLGSARPRLSKRPKVGTTIGFTLSEPARTTFAFARLAGGRSVGGRCVKTNRRNRTRRHCTRTGKPKFLSSQLSGGAHTLRFAGRLGGRARLGPGRYALTIGAVDSAGNASNKRTLRFAAVR